MANPVDLLFQGSPAVNGDLLFGGEVEAPAVDLTITGSFEPLSVSLFVGPVETLEITGTFAPLTVDVFAAVEVKVNITGEFEPLVVMLDAVYASNTARPTVNRTVNPWQVATQTDTGVQAGQQDSPALPSGWDAIWARAKDGGQNIEHRLPSRFVPETVDQRTVYQEAARSGRQTGFKHQDGDRTLRTMLNDAFEQAALYREDYGFRHQDGDRTKRTSRTTSFQPAVPFREAGHTGNYQSALRYLLGRSGPFQRAVRPPPGQSVYDPGIEPPFTCYTPNPDILFSFPFNTSPHLIFQCGNYDPEEPPPVGEIVVPVRKVYIVANNVSLRRVSDNALIQTLAMSLSLDVDSWSWGFSASLPAQALSLVEPTTGPIELKALVNGTEFRVLAENLSRERVFGQSTIRVSGRGRNAMLDAPYAPIQTFENTESRTAQQLMNDVLTLNGIPLGWTINWELEDWSVPGGVFSHQGSYITALTAIAQSAGGYLLPHPMNNSFKVLHRYPTVPWEWDEVTPNFTLPSDVAVREALQWREKPLYNRVFVSGQEQGILGQVTRAGTAGELLAPMVVDPLITNTIAARQRGQTILSDTGRQIAVTMRLPVLAETGIILPGAFVRYEDAGLARLGLVRGVNVDVGFPEVWQSLEIETHVS